MMNDADYTTLLECLTTAAQTRESRWQAVPGPHGAEPAFVAHEAALMLTAVNTIRTRNGLPPATLDQIRAIETSASGHADYAHKYALRCTHLANSEDT